MALSLCTAAITLNSCITAGVTAATSLVNGGSLVSSFTDLLSSKSAPENMAKLCFNYDGNSTLAGIEKEQKGSIKFGSDNPTLRKVGGVQQSIFYARKNDKQATITITGASTEVYRLHFTSGTEGTYTYVNKGIMSSVGDGSFRITEK